MSILRHLMFALLFMRGIAVAQVAPQPPLPDFDRIIAAHHRQRADAVTKVDIATIKLLSALKVQYMQRANLEASNKIQTTIDDLNREIAELAVHATPPIGGRGGRGGIYTDKHEGQAGHPEHVSKNIYTLDVLDVSSRAVLIINAIPPKKSSHGEFRLQYGNTPRVVGEWDQVSAQAGQLEFDVSKYVTRPGKYMVEVKYRGGIDGLHTTSVSIDTRPK